MKNYKINVVRISYAIKEIEVSEASSIEEAKKIAIDTAYSVNYEPSNEFHAEYQIHEQ